MNAEEIVAGMEKKQKEIEKEIKDMSYTIFVNVSTRDVSRTDETDILYKKPKKYKIIGKKLIIVTNGTITWIYKPQEKSVRILNAPSEDFVPLIVYAKVIKLILNNSSIAEYKGTELVENRKAHKIMLVLKKQLDNFSYWFWVDDETGLLLKTQTYRDDKPVLTLEHRIFKINTEVQDSEFEFVIPDGVKVTRKDGQLYR
ncbi:MAG: sigma-E factor regulatory protein RseB domain-containing protein [archaeon]|nr:sigma-E factor regulatory protein RseB domain-containing protein [archaeon]MDI6885623.1 sigma-E factor regulatory protein RseB domain-containing protein [archaeon]